MRQAAHISSSSALFDRVLLRALLDLRLLRSTLHGLHYFAAGVPWFATLFGRDAATVAIQTLPYGWHTAGVTARLLARYQAIGHDAYLDAEPGKILHELRRGELSRTGGIPQSPAYYGSIDATLLILILLGEYVSWSGDVDLVRRLRPSIDAALAWIDRYADHDRDGYLDYSGVYAQGLVNQGWKDSGNAIVDAAGSMGEPPIALCEEQAYLFRAWLETAALLDVLGDAKTAIALRRRAEELRERFESDLRDSGLQCDVLGRQRGGQTLGVVASNASQVLWSGIARPGRAARVVERLMAPDMFCGWGIRTLSSGHPSYNPMRYHLGSVWPHDNALILSGFCRYGERSAALQMFNALFDAAAGFRGYRLPELFCGFARRCGEGRPVPYPVACSPQAWAAAALPHALWTLLGLRADALNRRLYVVRPCLPADLTELWLRGLRVGDAVMDLTFVRRSSESDVEVSASIRSGDITISRE